MVKENFENSRKRVLRDHKRMIVKSALNGYEKKGRGLVLVELADTGEMRHLSYLPLDTLKQGPNKIHRNGRDDSVLIEETSSYYPNSQILVMVTDGEYMRLSRASRQATR